MINKVILIGYVGSDPEVRSMEGGLKMARLSIATNEKIFNRKSGQTTDHTEWHRITLWHELADVADRFVKKGSKIYVEGRLRSREWTDNAGTKHNDVEIVASDIKLLDRRGEEPTVQAIAPASPYTPPMPTPVDDPDDLPF